MRISLGLIIKYDVDWVGGERGLALILTTFQSGWNAQLMIGKWELFCYKQPDKRLRFCWRRAHWY